jgi:cation:H+ antiporter
MAVVDTGTLLQLCLGAVALAGLVRGAGLAVAKLLAIARYFGLSEMLIGLFVLSLGTSLPEIGTHVIASAGIVSGTLDYAIASGTVIGSNMGSSTAQQFLLVGVFLVGFGRYTVSWAFVRTSYLPMLATFVLLLTIAFDGTISRFDGVALLVAFAGYAVYSFATTERIPAVPDAPAESRRMGYDAAVALAALGVVLVSAFVVLSVVETVVARLQLSGSMLGVVTVGIAAALPELSTVLESIRRKTPLLALGTLFGTNIVNPLVGIGLGGAVSTYAVPPSVILWDLPFKLLVGAVALGYVFLLRDGAVGRREGVSLVFVYLLYVSGRLVLFPA